MKKCMTIIVALLMCVFMVMPVAAHPSRVVDDADLLSYEEEEDLARILDDLSLKCQFDIVVLTADDMGGQDIISYADDFYDYNGYGMGADYDGCILVLNMETREWYISTCGYGITALSDSVLNVMGEEFVPYLSDGYYYDGFVSYADLCAYYVEAARNGTSTEDVYADDVYTGYYEDVYTDGYYEPSYNSTAYVVKGFVIIFVVCLIIGFFVAFIPMIRLKRQMKTVAMKAAAADYVKPGSKRITKSRDAFLYSNVTRMPKPKQNSGSKGGGSSFGGGVHIGSSGRSHGGGGGRF